MGVIEGEPRISFALVFGSWDRELAHAGSDFDLAIGLSASASLSHHDVISRDLAERLARASGFRNLVAHRYGVLDPVLVHHIATYDLGDLEEFCAALALRAGA